MIESAPVYESAPIMESAPVYESPVYETAPVVTDDCCSGVVDEGYIEGSVDSYDSGSYDVIDSYETGSSEIMSDGEARVEDASALIVVNVPDASRVYVNGYQTTSNGTVRQFLSSGLEEGKSYAYEVRAVVEKDGKEFGETKVVRLTAGNRQELTFGALVQEDEETVLTIRVPEEATVELAGVETKMSGSKRVFATTKLQAGQTWDDYQVKVTLNGVTKEHTMTIRGGENHDLAFEFGGPQLAAREAPCNADNHDKPLHTRVCRGFFRCQDRVFDPAARRFHRLAAAETPRQWLYGFPPGHLTAIGTNEDRAGKHNGNIDSTLAKELP
jgi:uncharacterized protein (TIGR03000 family)